MNGVQHNVRVMPYCLCRVPGSHVLCFAVPQPRPELRFGGPYVLVAPLVQVPHVNVVTLTHNNHVQASSAPFSTALIDSMSCEELYQCVQKMECDLGLTLEERMHPHDRNDAYLRDRLKTYLIPQRKRQLKHEVEKLVEDWNIFINRLQVEKDQTFDESKIVIFKKSFDNLVKMTQKFVRNIPDSQHMQHPSDFLSAVHDILGSLSESYNNLQ